MAERIAYYKGTYEDYEKTKAAAIKAGYVEGGDFLVDKGITPARWSEGYWDGNEMAGEPRYYVPGCWFAWFNGDTQYVCFPTHWIPLPEPPK